MRQKRVFLGLAAIFFAVSTFANDDEVSFPGTWSAEGAPAGDGLTAATFSSDTDPTKLRIAAQLSLGGRSVPFQTTGTLKGDVLELRADLPRGLVERLGADGETDRLEGTLELQRRERAIVATWQVKSRAVSGRTRLVRSGTGWKETPLAEDARGLPVPGSDAAERELLGKLAGRVVARQAQEAKASGDSTGRAFHKKGFGLRARFRVLPEIPADLRVDIFQPGRSYDAIVRFSNGTTAALPDAPFDPVGLAIRVKPGNAQRLLSGVTADARDFLAIDVPVTPADPIRFTDIAIALNEPDPVAALKGLAPKYGAAEITALLEGLAKKKAAQKALIESGKATGMSFAELTWHSGAPIKWGDLAVKYKLVPLSAPGALQGADRRSDLTQRLKQSPMLLDMYVQRFKSESETPIENGSVAWQTPFEKVAQLLILKQDADAADGSTEELAREIDATAFTPWNTVEALRPLGAIMRARRVVYEASADGRGAKRCPFGFGRK